MLILPSSVNIAWRRFFMASTSTGFALRTERPRRGPIWAPQLWGRGKGRPSGTWQDSPRVRFLPSSTVDVALRVGSLADSSAIARKIGVNYRVLAASPAYLAEAGTPQKPSDLPKHSIIVGPAGRGMDGWVFQERGQIDVRAGWGAVSCKRRRGKQQAPRSPVSGLCRRAPSAFFRELREWSTRGVIRQPSPIFGSTRRLSRHSRAYRVPWSNRECEEPVDESTADAAKAVIVERRELRAELLAQHFRAARSNRRNHPSLRPRAHALLTGLHEIDSFAHDLLTHD